MPQIDLMEIAELLENNEPVRVLTQLKTLRKKNAQVLFLEGEAHRQLGNFETALKTYAKALQVADVAEDRMDILLAMSACYRTLGHSAPAYELALETWEMAHELEYEDYEIRAMQEMGMSLRSWGKLDEALELLDAVLAAYVQLKDMAGQSFIHWAKGGIFRLQGQFKEGIAQYKKSIALAQKIHDKINEAYGYCGLAGISRICGQIDACVKNYKLAEKIFKNSQDVFGKAYTQCGMANGLRQQGRYTEALRHYNLADELYSSIGDKVDLGFVKWGRADVLKRKNKLDLALKDLQEASVLFNNSDEKRGQILTKLSLAQVLYALGRVQEAEALYEEGVKQARQEGLHTYLESYT